MNNQPGRSRAHASRAHIRCLQCAAPVTSLGCVRFVWLGAGDQHLVVDLSKLEASVEKQRPHHEGDRYPHKKGKLFCACGNNLGNIQNNVEAAPFRRGKEAGLLKFRNICFDDPISSKRLLKVSRAGLLGQHILRGPAKPLPCQVTAHAYQVTSEQVFANQ